MGDRLRAGIPSQYVTSQQSQLTALLPCGVAESSTSFGWGKGGNVTSAGWQITLCNPIWHASFRNPVAVWQLCELLYTCYLLVTSRPLLGGFHLRLGSYNNNNNNINKQISIAP